MAYRPITKRVLIIDAMLKLSAEHRTVIYRAYYQRHTIGRIAADLKISEPGVKLLLHDGLRALKRALDDVAESA